MRNVNFFCDKIINIIIITNIFIPIITIEVPNYFRELFYYVMYLLPKNFLLNLIIRK